MLISEVPRNFWHVSHTREARVLGHTMRKLLVRVASTRFISFSSSFKPASKEALGSGNGGVRRATAGRFAVTRVTQSPPDWPCANLTYRSRTLTTLLFSSLAELYRDGERTREDEIHEIEERRDGETRTRCKTRT